MRVLTTDYFYPWVLWLHNPTEIPPRYHVTTLSIKIFPYQGYGYAAIGLTDGRSTDSAIADYISSSMVYNKENEKQEAETCGLLHVFVKGEFQ